MTRRFIVRPLAEADLEDAARWYEDEQAGLVERFLSDVDQTFWRIRPPQPGGNTMNWIVGHVVRTRNQAVGLLGDTPLFGDADFEAYGAGSTATKTLPLDELQRRFDTLGLSLDAALKRTSAQHLAAVAPFSPTGNPDETIGTLLASIAFHEAYHLGQTGLSRRLLGKAGALLAPGEAGHVIEPA